MKNIAIFIFISAIIHMFPQTLAAQVKPKFKRQYKTGDVYRYKLTLSEYNNDKLQFTNISVCELRVVDSNRMPYDEVRWLSKKVIRGNDTTDQTPVVLSTTPYRISLAGFGAINMPKIERPEMTEPIEDFNTFFAAVNPGFFMLGRFAGPGDSVAMMSPIKVSFANGSTIPRGEDCLAISLRITDTSAKETRIRTSFMPPAKPCLSYISADMSTPVVSGSLNNFQMVSPVGNKLFEVQYGREFFYINSVLSNLDGKILRGEMYNQLNLKIKHNCGSDYQGCQSETPFFEVRKLTLELLNE